MINKSIFFIYLIIFSGILSSCSNLSDNLNIKEKEKHRQEVTPSNRVLDHSGISRKSNIENKVNNYSSAMYRGSSMSMLKKIFLLGLTFCSSGVNSANNSAPEVIEFIPSRIAIADQPFIYEFPVERFFYDKDPLTLSAEERDSAGLPSWLHLNSTTNTFKGYPDLNNVGNYDILLTASDPYGLHTSDLFTISVYEDEETKESSSIYNSNSSPENDCSSKDDTIAALSVLFVILALVLCVIGCRHKRGKELRDKSEEFFLEMVDKYRERKNSRNSTYNDNTQFISQNDYDVDNQIVTENKRELVNVESDNENDTKNVITSNINKQNIENDNNSNDIDTESIEINDSLNNSSINATKRNSFSIKKIFSNK